jgi:hypothetical protein
MTELSSDVRHCPLCGSLNDCGVAAGKPTCWCFEEAIPDNVLDKVPAEARGRMCVYRACATGHIAPETLPLLKEQIEPGNG